jgi:hypothetical protein
MRIKIYRFTFLALVVGLFDLSLHAQDTRTQYPRFLSRSYIGLNMGYINYPFSNLQLEPGFQVESIHTPHLALQVLLIGHHINKNLSAQISYLRPVNWVEYKHLNGDQYIHYVRMNIAGLTAKYRIPIIKNFSAYGEGGLAVITRKGFKFGNTDFVKDANYASILGGAGLQYRLNKNWDLKFSASYSPRRAKDRQPHMVFYSTGFNYNMHPLSKERVEKNSNSGFIFPKHLIQVGFSTNHFTYGANNFVSEGKIPIFWGGEAEVKQGVSLHYQRNVFHGRKLFSLDLGTSFSAWKSKNNKDEFYTLSVFPLFRFTFLRTPPADMYFYYSVAGPAFISKTTIDNINTGKHFTFQDLMGIGIFAGKNRQANAEVRIGHYSNGNIFPYNEGVKIPLTFNLGYSF